MMNVIMPFALDLLKDLLKSKLNTLDAKEVEEKFNNASQEVKENMDAFVKNDVRHAHENFMNFLKND
tara:strand:- start:2695 stop:2895 length:201 start_codon:yes stop_codon:yes gene_type:complete